MDLRNRKYYLVRDKHLSQWITIEQLKHYYPINMKSGNYNFGTLLLEQGYPFNGMYHHKISIKKEYAKYLEYFMNRRQIQYVEIFVDPIVKHKRTSKTYCWDNILEEVDLIKAQCNYKRLENIFKKMEKNNERIQKSKRMD